MQMKRERNCKGFHSHVDVALVIIIIPGRNSTGSLREAPGFSHKAEVGRETEQVFLQWFLWEGEVRQGRQVQGWLI